MVASSSTGLTPRSTNANPAMRPADPVFVRAPLFLPALGMIGGILLDFYQPLSAGWYVVGAAIALLVIALAGWWMSRFKADHPFLGYLLLAALLGLSVSAGAFLFHAQYRCFETNHLVWHVPQEPIFARLRGELITTPIVVDPPISGPFPVWQKSPRTRTTLQVNEILTKEGWRSVSGLVQLHVQGERPDLVQGDVVEAFARLFRTPRPDNPGEFRWDELQRRRRVLLGASTGHPQALKVIQPAERSPNVFALLLAKFRRLAAAALNDEVIPDDQHAASLLNAMVLGQRSATDRAIEAAFQRTGTTHLLSVSGFHLAFLAALAWGLARLLTRRLLVQGLVVLALVFSYLLLAEPTAPLIRSAVVCVVGALALMLSRPYQRLNWLAGSAIVTLTLNPGDLFAAGFQLSYASLISILYLAPVSHRRWFGWLAQRLRPRLAARMPWWKRAWRGAARYLSEILSVSLAAALAGCAVGWYHFGAFSPYAALNSLILALPVGAMLVVGYVKWLISGFLFLLTGAGLPDDWTGLNFPLAWVLSKLLSLLSWMVFRLSELPGSLVRWPAPPLWLLWVYLAALGVWAYRKKLGRSGAATLLAVAVAYPVSLLFDVRPPTGELWFDLLSVGQGQAAFLRSDDGQVLVYDCGSISPFDLAGATLAPYLHDQGLRRIETVVVSHPDWDHYSGVPVLQTLCRVGSLRVNPQFTASSKPAAMRFCDDWQKAGGTMAPLARGDQIKLGEATLTVLWPPQKLELTKNKQNNLFSLVIRLEYAGRPVLLCGDVPAPAQKILLEEHLRKEIDLRAEAMVLPHHGHVTTTTAAFVAAVNPKICLRSDGIRTDWTFSDLPQIVAGREYHNTADEGGLRLVMSKEGIRVEPLVKKAAGP